MNYILAVKNLSNKNSEDLIRKQAEQFLLNFYAKTELLKNAARELSNQNFVLLEKLDESLAYFDGLK